MDIYTLLTHSGFQSFCVSVLGILLYGSHKKRARNAIIETKDQTLGIGYPSGAVAANSYLPSAPAQGETFSPGLFMLNNAMVAMQRTTHGAHCIRAPQIHFDRPRSMT